MVIIARYDASGVLRLAQLWSWLVVVSFLAQHRSYSFLMDSGGREFVLRRGDGVIVKLRQNILISIFSVPMGANFMAITTFLLRKVIVLRLLAVRRILLEAFGCELIVGV
jgi:hypothetical protein